MPCGIENLSGLDSGLDWQRAVSVRTEVMPAYEVERMEPPDPVSVPPLAEAVTDMQTLADLAQGQFGPALAPLAEAYAAWITAQEARLAAPAPDLAAYADVAAGALADCRAALGRMRAGIAVLDADPAAAQAFKFANRAMQLQRIRFIFAREARGGRQPDLEQIDLPANRTWRPFQLAFILLNLPALADPRHPDRSDAPTAAADLLWFPTGGGKTEAYLGVAAFTLAIRRLQGELGGLSGAAGVAVLMRYTLRLLTLQHAYGAARRHPHLRVRDDPPGRSCRLGARTVPHRPLGGAAQHAQLDQRCRRGDQAGSRHRVQRGRRHALPTHELSLVRPAHRARPRYPGRDL